MSSLAYYFGANETLLQATTFELPLVCHGSFYAMAEVQLGPHVLPVREQAKVLCHALRLH